MKKLHCLLGLFLLFISQGTVQAQTAVLKEVGAIGPRSQRLNLVFLSEGFTQEELTSGKFANHVDGVLAYLFSKEPWNRYRSYFNVFLIEIPSNQSGTDNSYANPPYTRDTYFGTSFHPQIERLLVLSNTGTSRAYSLLNKHVPEYDIPVVIVNDETYGGSGGPIAVASLDYYGAQLVEHEVGHSFAKLADEYDNDTPGYPAIEYPNATAKTQRSQIRWNMWIDPQTPLPTEENKPENEDVVGLYEGANYRAVGWFRPHDGALMRFLGRPAGAVCREAFVLNYYARVSQVDAFTPALLKQTVTQRTPLTFSVTPKVPSVINGSNPALSVVWKKNGQPTPLGTGTTLNIPSQDLGNGTHTLTAEVTDPSTWVRRDPGGIMTQKITWTLTLSNQGLPPTINQAPVHVLTEVGNPVDFSVTATPAGAGSLTYQWYREGKAISKATTPTLSIPAAKVTDAGYYSVRVTGDGAYAEPVVDLVVVDETFQTLVLAQGKSATLAPSFGGPILDHEWRRNNLAIPTGATGIAGLDTGKLVISPLNVNSHTGTYGINLVTRAGSKYYPTHKLDIFNEPPLLTVASDGELEPGRVGVDYSQSVQIEDILGRKASVYGASGLPKGLKVDTKTGIISGRPTVFKVDKAGNVIPYLLTLTAGNGAGTTKSLGVKLRIDPLPAGSVGPFVAPLARTSPGAGLNGGLGGRLDLTTTPNGGFSGKVTLGAVSHGFSGVVDATLNGTVITGAGPVLRKGKTDLHLDFTISGPNQLITGTITGDGDVIPFSGWLNPWTKTNLANAFDGYYTFGLGLSNPPLGAPTGHGYGSFTIAANGTTKITGRTPDGETFTSSTHVGRDGSLLLFALQKGKPQGSIAGLLSVDDNGDTNDANNLFFSNPSALTWWKPASQDAKARIYKNGVGPVGLITRGGRYKEPENGLVALDVSPGLNNANLSFSGASFVGTTHADVSIEAKSKATVAAAAPLEKTTLTINAKLGTFTGKFALTNDNPRSISPLTVPRAVTYQGMLVRTGSSSILGEGYFLLNDLPSTVLEDTPDTSPTQSGEVLLQVQN